MNKANDKAFIKRVKHDEVDVLVVVSDIYPIGYTVVDLGAHRKQEGAGAE